MIFHWYPDMLWITYFDLIFNAPGAEDMLVLWNGLFICQLDLVVSTPWRIACSVKEFVMEIVTFLNEGHKLELHQHWQRHNIKSIEGCEWCIEITSLQSDV